MLSLKVKLNFENCKEIKRIQLARQPEDLTMDELCVTLQRLFPIAIKPTDPLILKYQDDEGDLVNLENDQDIKHALDLSTTLRLHVFGTKNTEISTKNVEKKDKSEIDVLQESLTEIKAVLKDLQAQMAASNAEKLKDLAFTAPQPIDTSSRDDKRPGNFASTSTASSPIPQQQPAGQLQNQPGPQQPQVQYGTNYSQTSPMPPSPAPPQAPYPQPQMAYPGPQQHLGYAKPSQPPGQQYFSPGYPQHYQQAPPQQYAMSTRENSSPLPPPKTFR